MVTRPGYIASHLTGYVGNNPVRLGLMWRPSDPVAVLLVLSSSEPDAEPMSWSISRDLLNDGLSDWPVGDGDVRAWTGFRSVYHLRLSSDGVVVTVKVLADEVVDFLDACEEICSAGSIDEAMRLERALDAFLSTAGDTR